MWGGRFKGSLSEAMWRFTTDESDRRLLQVDIEGSIAHVEMLGATNVIEPQEAQTLAKGLRTILAEAEADEFAFQATDEDVHTAVERRLGEIVGETAGKLHTGRSRNDQVALDLRLYLSRAGAQRAEQLQWFAGVIASMAETHAETVIPSYTHLQQAQPTTLGHHLLTYAWMALRGADRFTDAVGRIAMSPLGAGASAGSSLPLDRDAVAKDLELGGVIPNSLDAVGSRDFVSEYVFCCAQSMIELSRLAEEIVLWSTKEFGWVSLGDEVSTGSSALPQKRNPDIAELIRGRAGTVAGDVTAILALQKALPLAYNRDLQEDKRIVFHADDTLASALGAMVELLGGLEFHPPGPGSETVSLDLAEELVRRGVSFREAHTLVGELVALLEARGKTLSEATIDDLIEIDQRFEEADLDRLDPTASVRARATSGSGSPQSVRAQIDEIRRRI
ncbi:MAG: argininosuccinate lyase [Actinobacteria bacterium]|nr:argininosuccinate lyase [Actinomycetota bacterium]